jgi:hypothetical protein
MDDLLANRTLITQLRDARDRLGPHQRMVTFAAATIVVEHFLGREFARAKVLPSETPDAFMGNSITCFSTSIDYIFKLISLANYLIRLRNCVGFDVLVERFKTRAMRAAFFDARAASLFVPDFDVKIRKESGVRGQDFDFSASRAETTINVEVTELNNSDFSETNIMNALRAKRSQVPDTDAAILYCSIPFSWLLNAGDNLNAPLTQITYRFFGGSRRFNAVIYSWTPQIQIGGRYVSGVVDHLVLNPSARHPLPDNGRFLYQDHPLAESVRAAIDDHGDLPAGDFYGDLAILVDAVSAEPRP